MSGRVHAFGGGQACRRLLSARYCSALFRARFFRAALWVLAGKKVSRRRSLSHAFRLRNLYLVYILNRLAFPARPKLTVALNLAALAPFYPAAVDKKARKKPFGSGRKREKHPRRNRALRLFRQDP